VLAEQTIDPQPAGVDRLEVARTTEERHRPPAASEQSSDDRAERPSASHQYGLSPLSVHTV
jgi:hypothetical protein